MSDPATETRKELPMLPLVPFLVTAGMYGTAIQGAKLILKGTEELTGIPVHTAVGGFVDAAVRDVRHTVGGIVEPVVSGFDLGIVAGAGEAIDKMTTVFTGASLQRQPIRTPPPVIAGVDRAKSKLETAGRDAARAEQQAAAVDLRANGPVEKNVARAGRRYATLARVFSQRSEEEIANNRMDRAEKYADLALSTAGTALNPRIDARAVFASDKFSDHQKSVVGKVVDDVNRDQEPNYKELADLMAFADAQPAAAVAGHGHEHGPGHACGCATSPKATHCNACRVAGVVGSDADADVEVAGDDDEGFWSDDDGSQFVLAGSMQRSSLASCTSCDLPSRRK